MEYFIIAADYFKNIAKSAVEEIVVRGSYNRELVFSLEPWSSALQNYLILTHNPSLIKISELSLEELFLNRYYWFKKFYVLYSRENGIDAGIEQQIGMLIETIGNTVKDFNWSELERIDKLIHTQG